MPEANKNILIIAGGTGGHISPGIALFQEFSNYTNTYFLTLLRNRNYTEFSKKNINPYYYDSPKFSKNIKDIILFPIKIITSILISIKIIRKHKINIIIGMGGYPTVPAIIAGILMNKEIYLCEQNVIPGNVTKLFSYFAKKIFLTFPIDKKKYSYIYKKSIITGNPIRKELFSFIQNKTNNKKIQTIFITGGSQGAKQINDMIWNLWVKYPEFSKKFYWIIQTGIPHYEEFQYRINNLEFKNQIECFGFSTEIYEYFKKSDLMVCRAGAGNITEGILFSLPMILIPYPYAKDNHQYENAKYIEEHKAGIIIYTKKIEPENLFNAINTILNNYDNFKKNIEKLRFKDNPAQIIKNHILN